MAGLLLPELPGGVSVEYTSSVFSRLEQLFQTEGWRKRLPLPGSESQVNWDILTSYPEEFPVKKKEHLMRSHTDLGYIPSLNGSVQSSHSVVSDSSRPHGLQHARPPCPSPTPGAYSDSRPWSQ